LKRFVEIWLHRERTNTEKSLLPAGIHSTSVPGVTCGMLKRYGCPCEHICLDYFLCSQVVDQHFNARQHVSELRKQLEERATMLRSIQKRLLMRFKVSSCCCKIRCGMDAPLAMSTLHQQFHAGSHGR
jgi:hypothetical protein